MNKEEIYNKVQSVICEVLKIEPDKVTLTSSFRDDLLADSLTMISLLFELEDIFEDEFDNDEVDNLQTVNDVVELIFKLKTKKN